MKPTNMAVSIAGMVAVGIYVLQMYKSGTVRSIVVNEKRALDANIYRQQRNKLSQTLNNVKHQLSIIQCERAEANGKEVSGSGGWCKKASTSKGGQHRCDIPLAKELVSFFAGQSVASFGDGPGDYKKFIDKTTKVKVYDAFDGAPYGPENSGGLVKFLDLTAPQYGLPVYDWVISLEVAEHIPAVYESIYIDNIVRHAKTGIVLSWAVPGQGGLAHVNNRPFEYVVNVLSAKGFHPDMNASKVLQQKATFNWLKRNTFVYRRKSTSFIIPEDA